VADKPGDFFVGVIDFFGILLPGAILLFLDGDLLSRALALPGTTEGTARWVVFCVASYVLGHFVVAASVKLNDLHSVYRSESNDPFYNEVKDKISLPANLPKNRSNAFYRAFAFVRLKSPAGLIEIERQMAEYKLFRSLVLVFAFDFLISLLTHKAPWRLALSILLSVGALLRFVYLLNWTRRITFEYYALLHSNGSGDARDPLIE